MGDGVNGVNGVNGIDGNILGKEEEGTMLNGHCHYNEMVMRLNRNRDAISL